MLSSSTITLAALSSLTSGLATYKIVSNLALNQDSSYKNIKSLSEYKKLKNKEILNIKIFNSSEYGMYVKNFYEVLNSNLDREYLKILNNNIESLKILNYEYDQSKNSVMGLYLVNNNTLYVPLNNPEASIYHELFHMASSYREKNILYSGFYQVKYGRGGYNVGKSINEGYTELLTQKYFKNSTNEVSYSFEAYICILLALTVGNDKMMKLYLSANLKGLVDELNKYTNYDDINKFLYYMDFISKYRYEIHLDNNVNNEYEYALEYVYNFVYRVYTTKVDIDSELYGFTEDKKDYFINEINTLLNMLNKEKLYKK